MERAFFILNVLWLAINEFLAQKFCDFLFADVDDSHNLFSFWLKLENKIFVLGISGASRMHLFFALYASYISCLRITYIFKRAEGVFLF